MPPTRLPMNRPLVARAACVSVSESVRSMTRNELNMITMRSHASIPQSMSMLRKQRLTAFPNTCKEVLSSLALSIFFGKEGILTINSLSTETIPPFVLTKPTKKTCQQMKCTHTPPCRYSTIVVRGRGQERLYFVTDKQEVVRRIARNRYSRLDN